MQRIPKHLISALIFIEVSRMGYFSFKRYLARLVEWLDIPINGASSRLLANDDVKCCKLGYSL